MADGAKPEYRVGVIGGGKPLIESCGKALGEKASVVDLTDRLQRATSANPARLDDVDAVLVALGTAVKEEVQTVARVRKIDAMLPVLLVGRDVGADLAVEIVKCGADDFLSAGTVATVLRPKLERALGMTRGPALDNAVLEPFRTVNSPPREDGANRRKAARVRPHPPKSACVLIAQRGGGEAKLWIEDMSIPTDGWPGGMLLSTELPAGRLPLREWEHNLLDDPVRLVIPDGHERRIPATSRLLPGLRRRTNGLLRLAIQYLVENRVNADRVSRYWAKCRQLSTD